MDSRNKPLCIANLNAVYDALSENEIEFEGSIEPKTGWQRFSSLRKSYRNENVYVYIDHSLRWGLIGEWGHTEKSIFVRLSNQPLSFADRQRIKQRLLVEEREQKAFSEKITRFWQSLEIADPVHPYLIRKKIPPWYVKQHKKRLVLPIYNQNGLLISLQFVYPSGMKRFLKGGKTKNGFMFLGERKTKIVRYVEGYATGMSVHLATMDLVVVCFSSGNMPNVASQTKDLFQQHQCIICGDNGTAGMRDALRAGRNIGPGTIAVIPQFYSDFNDLHVYEGLEAVEGQLYRYLHQQ